MKVDLTDPDTIYKVFESLTKKARQRLVCAAVCGKTAFYTQMNIECVLMAVGAETDAYYDDTEETE